MLHLLNLISSIQVSPFALKPDILTLYFMEINTQLLRLSKIWKMNFIEEGLFYFSAVSFIRLLHLLKVISSIQVSSFA